MSTPDLPDVAPILERMAEGRIEVLTRAECAAVLLHIRILTFNLESARSDLAGMKRLAAAVAREAGSGITLSAHVRGRALRFTPAKRALVEEVAVWIDDWSARVKAVVTAGVSS
jgi:hypothetical protein